MEYYSLKDVARLYGRPYSTTCRHWDKVKNRTVKGKKVFKKITPGSYYSANEMRIIAMLLDFDFPQLKIKK